MGKEHWIWLQEALGPGSNKLAAVLSHFGSPEAVFAASEAALRALPALTAADREKLLVHELSGALAIQAACRRLGYWLLTADDPAYPKRLLRIFNPPALLYGKGKLPPVDDEAVVSIVGTRRAGEESRMAAASLAARLTRAGVLIVSGGAEGVDAAAHRGALAAGGLTVAVLGGGLDAEYPKANAELRKEIAENGCLLSEYPPGAPTLAANYPVRNRIIAALCLGVVIMEAGERSGALLTAGHALEQGKDIFVLPGGDDDPAFAGSRQLLWDGARPLDSALDILEEYAGQYPHKLDLRTAYEEDSPGYRAALREAARLSAAHSGRRRKGRASVAAVREETQEETLSARGACPIPASGDGEERTPSDRAVFGLPPPRKAVPPPGATAEAQRLWKAVGPGEYGIDELAVASGLSADRILPAVTELEIYGLLKALPGGRYTLAHG